jgi:hypothetical protein
MPPRQVFLHGPPIAGALDKKISTAYPQENGGLSYMTFRIILKKNRILYFLNQ